MDAEKISLQMRVRTNPKLFSTAGFIVAQRCLDARRANAEGTIGGYVPGHGGDVWFVAHDDGSVGAYSTDEFEPA